MVPVVARYFTTACRGQFTFLGQHHERDLYYCPNHHTIRVISAGNSVQLVVARDNQGIYGLVPDSYHAYLCLPSDKRLSVSECMLRIINRERKDCVGDAMERLKGCV